MTTDRLLLPTLTQAQAQKEMTHNEALLRLDAAVQATVVAVAPPAVPSAPTAGQCWIVGAQAGGAWSGHDGSIAAWTGGGWRFVAPFEGMAAWSVADSGVARRIGAGWRIAGRGAPIADPSGGTVVDSQARAALLDLLALVRRHGLVAT